MEGIQFHIAIFHPQYGEAYPDSPFKGRVRFIRDSLENSSIEISNLRLSDEGKFICEYSIYPSGYVRATTSLLISGEYGVLLVLVMVRYLESVVGMA